MNIYIHIYMCVCLLWTRGPSDAHTSVMDPVCVGWTSKGRQDAQHTVSHTQKAAPPFFGSLCTTQQHTSPHHGQEGGEEKEHEWRPGSSNFSALMYVCTCLPFPFVPCRIRGSIGVWRSFHTRTGWWSGAHVPDPRRKRISISMACSLRVCRNRKSSTQWPRGCWRCVVVAIGVMSSEIVSTLCADPSHPPATLMGEWEDCNAVTVVCTFRADHSPPNLSIPCSFFVGVSLRYCVLQDTFSGYSTTIFCYGQTGTGKTFTMVGGDGENRGIFPRAMDSMFSTIHADQGSDYQISIQCLQIYMEMVGLGAVLSLFFLVVPLAIVTGDLITKLCLFVCLLVCFLGVWFLFACLSARFLACLCFCLFVCLLACLCLLGFFVCFAC